jgi:hypothetical protein
MLATFSERRTDELRGRQLLWQRVVFDAHRQRDAVTEGDGLALAKGDQNVRAGHATIPSDAPNLRPSLATLAMRASGRDAEAGVGGHAAVSFLAEGCHRHLALMLAPQR